MTPLQLAFRAALGGTFIALMLWLATTQRPFVAGIFLFFPIFSLPTFFFLARDGGAASMDKVRGMIIGGIAALPVWLAFVGSLYWFSFRMRPMPALALSMVVWCLGAATLAAIKLLWFKA